MPVEYDRAPAEGAPVRKMDGSSSVAEVVSVILDKGSTPGSVSQCLVLNF